MTEQHHPQKMVCYRSAPAICYAIFFDYSIH